MPHAHRMVSTICAQCGKPTKKREPDLKRFPLSFCDRSCASKWRAAHDPDLAAKVQAGWDQANALPATVTRYATGADLWSQDVGDYYKALEADPCAYCGGKSECRDHIEPKATGGANHWTNYTGACLDCNARKATSSLVGYLLSIPLEPAVKQYQLARSIGMGGEAVFIAETPPKHRAPSLREKV